MSFPQQILWRIRISYLKIFVECSQLSPASIYLNFTQKTPIFSLKTNQKLLFSKLSTWYCDFQVSPDETDTKPSPSLMDHNDPTSSLSQQLAQGATLTSPYSTTTVDPSSLYFQLSVRFEAKKNKIGKKLEQKIKKKIFGKFFFWNFCSNFFFQIFVKTL